MRRAHGSFTRTSQLPLAKQELAGMVKVRPMPLSWGIMVKSVLWSGVAAAVFALLAGCSTTGITGSTGTNLANANGATGTIRIVNDSGEFLDVVLISDCDAFTYGTTNQLPPNTGIPDGSYYDFTVPAGCWDVAAGAFGVGDSRQRLTVPPNSLFELTIG
jgi:hypothetical protein